MNNNKLDEASLLAGGKGVFAKTSYITIGTKEYVVGLRPKSLITIQCLQNTGWTRVLGSRCFYACCSQPEKFSAKAPDRDGFKGKQFKTSPPKLGRTPDTYFEKKHPWVSEVQQSHRAANSLETLLLLHLTEAYKILTIKIACAVHREPNIQID